MTIKKHHCQVCDTDFDSDVCLKVHFQTEHICMYDGTQLMCPKSYCNKTWPNAEALRNHLISHYAQEILFTE
uniref:C2H2-type domain-containing protein n=1 Tax=Panagrellus redivivus TaxID=6233 RepID=A0A7E4V1S3_PANRE